MSGKHGILCSLTIALLLIVSVCAGCGGGVLESSGAGPLLSLLEEIPEYPVLQSGDLVYFADHAAMESAYDSERPANAEEALDPPEDEAHEVWYVVFLGSSWVYDTFWQASLTGGTDTVGFNPLQVDQALQFGAAPRQGLMLGGSFDAAKVSAAYEANIGLSPSEFEGATIWSWGDDPESGFMTDLAEVVRENPFGGFLGRRQPMTITDDLLMSSADIALVQAHVKAAAGEVSSMTDSLGCRLAVNAVAEDGELLQASIAGPTLVLPTTSLLIMADVVTEEEQIGRLALVYADADTAEAAGETILRELMAYRLQSGETGAEMFARLNVADPRYYVREGDGRSVLVLEFPTPKATSAEIAKMRNMSYESTSTRPGSVYRFVVKMFLQRDTGWLSSGKVTE